MYYVSSMGYVRDRNGKIVGYEASPDDPPDANQGKEETGGAGQKADDLDSQGERDSSDFFTPEDRARYPRRGHIPGSIFAPDGKIVTNPGLRETDFTPGDD